jgi:4-amino-4-deoxy-L-arabinose transferase-like glycosyltransferase
MDMERKSHSKTSSKTYLLTLFFIFVVSFTIISSSFHNIKFADSADEGYYLKYATYIGDKGVSGFQDLFKDYIENQQNWLFPNPLRIGFIILSSIWLSIFGYSFLNLAYFSLLSFYIFLLICFYFVKKYFGEKTALLLTILLAFSPLNMAMARRALMDSCANLFMVLSVWLFFDSLREKNIFKTALFILVYSFTILVKESSVLLSLFFIFYILIRRGVFKKPIKLVDLLVSTLLPFGIVGIIYVMAAGGMSYVMDTAEIIIKSPQTNQYAIMFCSGPWFSYLIDWILLSPWVAILAIAFSLHYVIKDEWKEEVLYLISFLFTFIFLFSFFTKNIRYLITLDMPIRLFAVLMLSELIGRVAKSGVFKIVLTFVIIIAFFDYLRFNSLFIKQGIYDPVTQWLLQFQHIIPWK